MMYGNVYMKCPVSGDVFWYDCCNHKDYVNRYGSFDSGRFLWVASAT